MQNPMRSMVISILIFPETPCAAKATETCEIISRICMVPEILPSNVEQVIGSPRVMTETAHSIAAQNRMRSVSGVSFYGK